MQCKRQAYQYYLMNFCTVVHKIFINRVILNIEIMLTKLLQNSGETKSKFLSKRHAVDYESREQELVMGFTQNEKKVAGKGTEVIQEKL